MHYFGIQMQCFIRNNIVLKSCARVKIFSTKISGKCKANGVFLLEISTKMMEIAIIFRG
jgi:hypothetical protein